MLFSNAYEIKEIVEMKSVHKKIIYSCASLVLIAAIGAGDVLYGKFKTDIIGQLCPPKVDTDAAQVAASEGKELSEKIEGEGIVMVKNDGFLPMNKDAVDNLSLLGFGNVQWIYGGSGSGRVLSQAGDSKWEEMTSLAKALTNYGIGINDELLSYYKKYATVSHDINSLNFNVDTTPYNFGLKDPDVDDPTYRGLLEESREISDTAVVTISRQGGESEDMPKVQYKSKPSQKVDETRHSLELSEEEEKLLEYALDSYEHIIVIINSTNSFQLDFLDKPEMKKISACLLVGATGEDGANAIPKVLYGEINPSGKLADTLPYDFRSFINYNNAGYDGISFYSDTDLAYGVNQKTNAGVTNRPSLPYIDYSEGIYVGYRYYETADTEGAFDSLARQGLDENGNTITKKGYDAVVQYPFGYGLNYTSFDWEVMDVSLSSGSSLSEESQIEFSVKVTNNGEVAGKDVVELYMTPQYNKGGIEKSSLVLVGFEKTEIIEPGKNQVVHFQVDINDFASYDCYDKNENGYKTYEIDKGKYELKLQTNSHEVKKVDFLGGKKNVDGILSYNVDKDIILDKDPVTKKEVKNLFTGEDAVDGVSIDGNGEEGENAQITYLSREDLKTTASPLEKSAQRSMGKGTKQSVLFAGANGTDKKKADEWDNAKTDVFGNPTHTETVTFSSKETNLSITDGKGEVTDLGYQLAGDYNDEKWNDLLDQLDLNQAINMVNKAHPTVNGVSSIGLPTMNQYDGPAQVGSFADVKIRGTGFPSNSTLAQTWNKTLCYEMGLSQGKDMESHGLDGYYGTAINIHRTPFGGRNYEYYSEDPILTGDMAAMMTKGVRDTGKISYVKHFAVAENETSRDSLYTWLTEQSLREIYLEPFRRVIEEGKADGLMTSYNRVGALWAGGSQALLEGVLRTEWGFNGVLITDYSDNNQYMNLDETLRAGGDLGMAVSLKLNITSSSSNRIKYALREAVHHTAYAYLDSKLAKKTFNENGGYKGSTITTANTMNSFNWVTPFMIDLNIAFIGAAVGLVYFGVFDAIGLNKDSKEGGKEE